MRELMIELEKQVAKEVAALPRAFRGIFMPDLPVAEKIRRLESLKPVMEYLASSSSRTESTYPAVTLNNLGEQNKYLSDQMSYYFGKKESAADNLARIKLHDSPYLQENDIKVCPFTHRPYYQFTRDLVGHAGVTFFVQNGSKALTSEQLTAAAKKDNAYTLFDQYFKSLLGDNQEKLQVAIMSLMTQGALPAISRFLHGEFGHTDDDSQKMVTYQSPNHIRFFTTQVYKDHVDVKVQLILCNLKVGYAEAMVQAVDLTEISLSFKRLKNDVLKFDSNSLTSSKTIFNLHQLKIEGNLKEARVEPFNHEIIPDPVFVSPKPSVGKRLAHTLKAWSGRLAFITLASIGIAIGAIFAPYIAMVAMAITAGALFASAILAVVMKAASLHSQHSSYSAFTSLDSKIFEYPNFEGSSAILQTYIKPGQLKGLKQLNIQGHAPTNPARLSEMGEYTKE